MCEDNEKYPSLGYVIHFISTVCCVISGSAALFAGMAGHGSDAIDLLITSFIFALVAIASAGFAE